ncbi:MAG: hypothetical protein Q8L06_13890 [Pseudohongiella sp.]|nr:hypothetical protein [Pseudohongiella sp.]
MTDEATTEPGTQADKSELSASIEWFRSLVVMTSALFRLAFAELSLAREDLGRLILSTLLFLPLLLMTWVAISLLAAWIVYEQSESATLGFSAFAAIHVLASVVLLKRISTYRRSLSLPVTRTQLRAIIGEIRRGQDNP